MLRQVILVALAASASASAGSYGLYYRCSSNGPAKWAANDGSFCGAEQQSPIDLCGATPTKHPKKTTYSKTRIVTGSSPQVSQTFQQVIDDPRYHITTTNNVTSNRAMKLKLAESVYIAPPEGHTLRLYAGDISYEIGRQDSKPSEDSGVVANAAGCWTTSTHTQSTFDQEVKCYISKHTVENDKAEWVFAEAHFRWGRDGRKDEGSEHYMEGVQYPLEVQLVHHHKKYKDLTEALAQGKDDALLVVGQFFDIDDSDTAGGVMSEDMKMLASAMSAAKSGSDGNSVNMNIYGLIDQSEGFFSYAGSLTTPTCNPVVTWVVMKNIQKIPSSTLDLFHDKTVDSYGHKAPWGNYRDLQPRGGRALHWFHGNAATVPNGTSGFWTCNPRGARGPHFNCPHEVNNKDEVEDLKTSLDQAREAEKKAKADLTVLEAENAHIVEEKKAGAGQNVAAIVLGVFFGLFLGAFVALLFYMLRKKQ